MDYTKAYFKLIFAKLKYHDITGKAAEVSFYLFFSIFPLFLLILSVLPLLQLQADFLIDLIQTNYPPEIVVPITYFLEYLTSNPSTTALGIGVILTIYSASTATNALLKNLNKIYETYLTRSNFQFRLISMGSTVLLLIAFALSVVLFSLTTEWVSQFLDPTITIYLSRFKEFLLPLFFIIILSFLYLVAPGSNKYLFQIFPGVIFSIISFELVNKLIIFIIANFGDFTVKYGTITSIIIFLLYLYVNTAIILFGGLINSTFMDINRISKKIEQNPELSLESKLQLHLDKYKD